MKEIQLKNLDNIEAVKKNWGPGNEFSVKPITEHGVMEKCAAAFVEVEPGNVAYRYHWHETIEEIFYIISGEGSVRTAKGEIPVKAGDAITFPTGKSGVHAIRNTSATEKLVYLDFGTRGECEISHHPDTGKMYVVNRTEMWNFDETEPVKLS